ncbi:MAG: ACT domain-containing protein [Ruminococcaceae bacterium]|nr:ACT domain-containing protein [Oscillospiraceae bacterium]
MSRLKGTESTAKHRMVLVDVEVLPDIIGRTLQAKRLLQTGEVTSVSQAVRQAGLSRTAFYKYRDAVLPYDEETAGRTITVQLTLRHIPGVISRVLDGFARAGANILTVSQTTPSGGVANASVSARIDQLLVPVDDFLQSLEKVDGVQRISGVTDG